MRQLSVSVRPWSRVAKTGRTHGAGVRELVRLQQDLVVVRQRLAQYGRRLSSAGAEGITRIALTRLQRELREATEENPDAAGDNLIQEVRKYLHLLLDH